jgi:6-phosphogluconolactonase
MAENEKFVAYVSTYTQESKNGIIIYDVDMEKGRFHKRGEEAITNASYLTISKNKKFLYSITDFGVVAYSILEDGNLKQLNTQPINGMRGCYVSTDYENRYLFVAGYHDGKLTVLRLHEDGSIGEITDEVYHKGPSSIADRNFRPHITCARMTRDNKYLLVADQGMDHVNVYRLDMRHGKVKLADVLRSELESAPKHIRLSQDGRFIYILHEWKCYIDVYSYEDQNGNPVFEKLQSISTLEEDHANNSAACALKFSTGYRYLVSSNASDNTVMVYNVNHDTGLLTKNFCLPISGEYPKDVCLFPDNRFLVSLNNESNHMTFFTADLEKGLIVMNGPKEPVNAPNCIVFHRLPTPHQN